MSVESGRNHTKTAPGCHVFRYWIDKPRTEGLTGEQIQAGTTAHQWAPEIVRKENILLPLAKTSQAFGNNLWHC